MKGDAPFLDAVLQEGHYLALLNLAPEGSRAIAAVETAYKQCPNTNQEVVALLSRPNWRGHLVAALAMMLHPELKTVGELWKAFDCGSWISPQLAVVAFFRDPQFVLNAKARIEACCPLDLSRFKSVTSLEKHVNAGSAGTIARSAKGLGALVFLLGGFPESRAWLSRKTAEPEVRALLEKDNDEGSDIAQGWLRAVREHFVDRNSLVVLPVGAQVPTGVKKIMVIAGETSGDILAAELVTALTKQSAGPLIFFGAGGPRMEHAGVSISIDMTAHSVIGLIEVIKKYFWFKKVFEQLNQLALHRRPDLIVCVDFSGFNRRFAHKIRQFTRSKGNHFGWNPKIVQFVSPQVWASRPSRADKMALDIDLLLCLFPFEKPWYAKRTPSLRVEFVGHPIADRFANDDLRLTRESASDASIVNRPSQILLLPGSRTGELKRHLPVMLQAAQKISAKEKTVRFEMVLPNEGLAKQARDFGAEQISNLKISTGDLAAALSRATLAIASTGTVTLECAAFGVPTIAMYKTSWSTYQIGKRIIQVKYLAMPNLLADEAIFPEFIQDDATPENIAREAIELLNNPARCEEIKLKLTKVVSSLGGPGASQRAATAILQLQ